MPYVKQKTKKIFCAAHTFPPNKYYKILQFKGASLSKRSPTYPLSTSKMWITH